MTIGWVAAGATHVGRVRKGNEDAFRLDPERGVFLVADGMGGHAAGEVASRLAADASLQVLTRSSPEAPHERLESAFEAAHRSIRECCAGDPETEGMGTTLTVAILHRDGSLYLGHIGDSRAYLLRGEQLRQLTHDHTWVQREIDGGRVGADEAKTHPLSHILTRVLTSDEPGKPDIATDIVRPGDVLLLCTDGLHNMLDGPTLLDFLIRTGDPAETCQRLIKEANRAGGFDNSTVIVIRISEG